MYSGAGRKKSRYLDLIGAKSAVAVELRRVPNYGSAQCVMDKDRQGAFIVKIDFPQLLQWSLAGHAKGRVR